MESESSPIIGVFNIVSISLPVGRWLILLIFYLLDSRTKVEPLMTNSIVDKSSFRLGTCLLNPATDNWKNRRRSTNYDIMIDRNSQSMKYDPILLYGKMKGNRAQKSSKYNVPPFLKLEGHIPCCWFDCKHELLFPKALSQIYWPDTNRHPPGTFSPSLEGLLYSLWYGSDVAKKRSCVDVQSIKLLTAAANARKWMPVPISISLKLIQFQFNYLMMRCWCLHFGRKT